MTLRSTLFLALALASVVACGSGTPGTSSAGSSSPPSGSTHGQGGQTSHPSSDAGTEGVGAGSGW